ncbi:MAG: hypothetical protein SFY70_01800 [Bacteroidia bacterium]|nr:hypothetical protein [Bacteroidia bacterium]
MIFAQTTQLAPSATTLVLLGTNALQTLTNMPAAAQLAPLGNVTSTRGWVRLDARRYRWARFSCAINNAGAPGAVIYPVFRSDLVSGSPVSSSLVPWTELGEGLLRLPLTPTGYKLSPWVPLPPAAKDENAVFWYAHAGGNGTADPALINVNLLLR